MRKAFHKQINEITEDVISMGALTQNAMYSAISYKCFN